MRKTPRNKITYEQFSELLRAILSSGDRKLHFNQAKYLANRLKLKHGHIYDITYKIRNLVLRRVWTPKYLQEFYTKFMRENSSRIDQFSVVSQPVEDKKNGQRHDPNYVSFMKLEKTINSFVDDLQMAVADVVEELVEKKSAQRIKELENKVKDLEVIVQAAKKSNVIGLLRQKFGNII